MRKVELSLQERRRGRNTALQTSHPPHLCKSVRSVGQKRVKKDPKDYLLFFILYNPTSQDTSFLTLSTHLQEYDLPLSPNSQ